MDKGRKGDVNRGSGREGEAADCSVQEATTIIHVASEELGRDEETGIGILLVDESKHVLLAKADKREANIC